MRTEGFRAQLGVRGVQVRIGALPLVSALIDDTPPISGQFVISNETRTSESVVVLRVDLITAGYTALKPGDVWEQAGGIRRRVVEVRDSPNDIAVRMPSETSTV